MRKATTLSSPFYNERPSNLPSNLPSVQIMSVDILPASIPLDASAHFSSKLSVYMNELVNYYNSTAVMTSFPVSLERATIATDGQLKPKHQWLGKLVQEYRQASKAPTSSSSSSAATIQSPNATPEKVEKIKEQKSEVTSQPSGLLRKKRILMLGSGMVAGPAVDMLARNPDVDLVVGSCLLFCHRFCDLFFLFFFVSYSQRLLRRTSTTYISSL